MVMKDSEDIIAHRQSIERTQVHIFLIELDKFFDQLTLTRDFTL